ncbi:MAG: hypothetical protein ACRETA_08800 [Gammaproteobacteria bacterium]
MQTQCPRSARSLALGLSFLVLAMATLASLSIRIERVTALTPEQRVQQAIALSHAPKELPIY